MGGKSKQSQRTKNNARPSSSGRSAGLLAPGATVLGGGGLFASLSLTNELPLSLELTLVFKKLNKKDPITKTKALQELTELVSSSKLDDLEMALPVWTHHYRVLAHDSDRRVRELTQCCQQRVVSTLGRRVAPYIKRLLPVWLQAAHDPHLPAALKARGALHTVFPGHKLRDALTFCRDDIMTGLAETLLAPLPQASKDNNEESEQSTAACRRAVCALGALGELADVAHGDTQWLHDSLLPVVHHAVFWKLLQHDNEYVRAAWYTCCARWCALVVPAQGARLLRSLLAHKETGAANAQRWEALIVLMTSYTDWYESLDKPDLLQTRLMALLETGGWGEARRLRDVILPLLRLLPSSARDEHFYNRYFDAAFKGLESKSVLYNTSERAAWTDMIAASLELATDGQRTTAASAALRQWLGLVLNHKAASSLIVSTAGSLTSLMRHWFRQQSAEGDRVARAVWLHIAYIHEQPEPIESPAAPHERPANLNVVAAIERHTLLFKSMHDSFYEKPKAVKKKKTITFEDEKRDENESKDEKLDGSKDEKLDGSKDEKRDESKYDKHDESKDETVDSTVQYDSGDKAVDTTVSVKDVILEESIRVRFEHCLEEAVAKVTAHWLVYGELHEAVPTVMQPVLELIRPADSGPMWLSVARHMGVADIYQLYMCKVFPWLLTVGVKCEQLVTLTLTLMPHMDKRQQEQLYTTFDQCDDTVVQWLVSAISTLADAGSLPDPPYADHWARWVQGPRACAALTAAVSALCSGDSGNMAAAAVLLMHSHTLPTVASCVSVALADINTRIMDHSHMDDDSHSQRSDDVEDEDEHPDEDDDKLNAALSRLALTLRLCAMLGEALHTRGLAHQHTDILVHIYTILLQAKSAMSAASRAVALEAVTSLHATLAAHAQDTVWEQVIDVIRRYIYDSAELSMRAVDQAAYVTSKLARIYTPPPPHSDLTPALCDRIDLIVRSLRPPHHVAEVVTHALRAEVVNGGLYCPVKDETYFIKRITEESETNEVSEVSKDIVIEYLKELSLRAYVIKYVISNTNDENDDNNKDSDETVVSDDETNNVSGRDVGDDVDSDVSPATPRMRTMLMVNNDDDTASDVAVDEVEKWLVTHTLQLLHDTAGLQALVTHCGYWMHHESVLTCCVRVCDALDNIVSALSLDARGVLQRGLRARAGATLGATADAGYFWAHAAASHCTNGPRPALPEQTNFHWLQAHGRLSSCEGVQLSAAWEMVASAVHMALVVMGNNDPAVGHNDPAVGHNGPAVGRNVPAVGRNDPAKAFVRDMYIMLQVDDNEEARTDVIMKVFYEHPHVFYIQPEPLSESRPPPLPVWEVACGGTALAHYLTLLVALRGWDLPPTHTDLATLALSALLDSVCVQADRIHNTKMAMLTVSTLRLYNSVESFVATIRPRSERQQPADNINRLPGEWTDLFLPSMTPRIDDLRHTMLGSSEPLSSNHVSVLTAVSACRVQGLSFTARTRLLEAAAARMAVCDSTALQTFAAIIIIDMSKELALDDEEALSQWGDTSKEEDDDDVSNARPLLHAARIAPLALTAVKRALVDRTDLTAARAALLLAEAMHRIAVATDHHERHSHYVHIYKEYDFIEPLLELCLQLLPRDVITYARARPTSHAKDTPPNKYRRYFTDPPKLTVTDPVSWQSVRALSCRALYTCLGGPGGVHARSWYTASVQRVQHVLERVTRAYIAPALVRAAVNDLLQHQDDIEDAEVRAHAVTGEIVLALEVDFNIIELQVTMSPLHPLCPTKLSGSGVGAVPQWLSVEVAREVSLRRALRLWARSVNRRVDAAPTCYVCYCRLQAGTGKLPNKPCRQCHNRFHVTCIRKWFQSSKKTNCPLCRHPF